MVEEGHGKAPSDNPQDDGYRGTRGGCYIVEASGLFRRGETGTEQNCGARGSGSGSGSSVEPCQPGTLFLQR